MQTLYGLTSILEKHMGIASTLCNLAAICVILSCLCYAALCLPIPFRKIVTFIGVLSSKPAAKLKPNSWILLKTLQMLIL